MQCKKGLVAYLTGNTEFGKTQLLCLSIDLGVRPDDINKPNTICMNGDIDINYVKAFPQVEQCKCKSDSSLVLVPSTSIIRYRGVCVESAELPIYKYNDDVLQKFLT